MAFVITHEKTGLEKLSPGVTLDKIQPGGRKGPNNEVLLPIPGGPNWVDYWHLGSPSDDFLMAIPDVRMPPNQLFPLHWHGCWIAVVVLDGTLLIGDWWMRPGDVFISAANLEYGPLVNGPEGCQLFEIFAKNHLAPGGYAPEYHDHPTLINSEPPFNFEERSPVNQRNSGRQTLPNAGVEGLSMSRLEPGRTWDLGEPDDPDRGLMRDTRLAAGEKRPAHTYADWHGVFIMDGTMRVGGRDLVKDDVLIIEPNSRVAEFVGTANETQLLEFSRTAKGMDPIPAA